jgi:predicted small secreted protein
MTITRFIPVLALLVLGACNTMQGVGQDVGAAGSAIEGEAAEVQSQL